MASLRSAGAARSASNAAAPPLRTRRLTLPLRARAQGEEGSLEATLRLNNALGYAETLEAHSAAGSQNSFMFALTATQQRLFGGSAAAEGRLGQTIRSFQKHSSFTEQARPRVRRLRIRARRRADAGWRRSCAG